jgi:predicted MPP superfamily phosphohydrolase
MKIRYFSDLHLEFIQTHKLKRLILDNILPIEGEEICILAGDIGYPDSENYDIFMKFISKHFIKTFVIAGNHEYYQKGKNVKNMEEMLLFTEEYFKGFDNMSFLNNSSEKYGDYLFIGSTLWSKIIDPSYEINDVCQIPDFNYIKYNKLNRVCVDYLKSVLETEKEQNCIIITHHVPSEKLIDEKYKTVKMKPYNQWFYCNLESLFSTNIKYWFYGHTHTPSISQIENIQFLCNPIGYPGENNKIDLTSKVTI